MRVHELVQAGGVRVAVVHFHAGHAVARNGKRLARHQACQQLRCLADALVVVHEHVGERVGIARAGMAAQVVHGQVAQFGFKDAARERQVRLHQLVDVRFLAGQQPVLIVVGKLGPAAVEEFQHLAQALRAQAADFHVLK